MARHPRFPNEAFLQCARDYLPTEASIREFGAAGKPGAEIHFDRLRKNRFCLGDADTAAALCHAVEDIGRLRQWKSRLPQMLARAASRLP